MAFLGAHFSIRGGYATAVDEAASLSCSALQIFTKNQVQWRAKPILKEEAREFRERRAARGIRFAFAHASYLINLCAADSGLFEKSIAALAHELERADALGLDFVVVHPGSGDLAMMKRGLADVLSVAPNRLLIETSAGQGRCVGWKFEELAELVAVSDRLGVCFDTCHVFAAGYDISESYERVIRDFDRIVGLEKIRAFHLNDSKQGLGSRVDRHEHIGLGKIGRKAFRRLMQDPRFEEVPKVLETPKEGGMDAVNLKLLRRFAPCSPKRV